MLWGLFKPKKPPIVEALITVSTSERMVPEKKFRSKFKKYLPHITSKELDLAVDILKSGERPSLDIRVSREAMKLFMKDRFFDVEVYRDRLLPVGSWCTCGDRICRGCAKSYKATMQYSETNIGLIQEEGYEGDEVQEYDHSKGAWYVEVK